MITKGRLLLSAIRRMATMVREAPHPQNQLDLFAGDWTSRLGSPHEALAAGKKPLFDDPCIHWLMAELGGVTGRSILELGSFEAGHTTMLERAGAGEIVGVEANPAAFLKGLLVKEIYGLVRSRFLLGDFFAYLDPPPRRFDLCIASGVLHHVTRPVELLRRIAGVSDAVYVWAHYFSPGARSKHGRFLGAAHERCDGRDYAGRRHRKRPRLDLVRYRGGVTRESLWLCRDDLLRALSDVGFTRITIHQDEPRTPWGPTLSLLARTSRGGVDRG